MSTSNILAILGILATIVFGVWGLVIVIRRRYPCEITYVREAYIALFDSIVKNLNELSVLYNNTPVGQGLVLVKGAFLNTGSKDITDSMVEGKLTFSLPHGFRWMTAKVVGTSRNVSADVTIADRDLIFTTGLFRCHEFIRFQAIAEIPLTENSEKKRINITEDHIDKAISISHRIADTKPVKRIDLPNTQVQKRNFLGFGSLWLAIVLTLITCLYILFTYYTGVPAELNYIIADTKGTAIEVSIRPTMDGKVQVKNVQDGNKSTMDVQKFFETSHPKPKVVMSHIIAPIAIIGALVYIFIPWITFLFLFRKKRRAEKLRILMQIEER
jgi:hypothetical protein